MTRPIRIGSSFWRESGVAARRVVLLCLVLLLASLPLGAQELAIGVGTETLGIDPHLSISNPTVGLTRHIFDSLAQQDEHQAMRPGLALSWVATGETEWEFRLRPGVRFHNGQTLTAEDVAFSLRRAASLPNVPSGFASVTRQITGIQVVDALTIRLRTDAPFPLMAEYLSPVGIVSHVVAEGAETRDFNSGRAAIGTGPFRFVSWTPGASVRLVRNDDWWAGPTPWQTVTIRPITEPAARVAALLSGEVDVIDKVPTSARTTIAARPDWRLSETMSNRVVFLLMSHVNGSSRYVTDAAGEPLASNPLRALAVRRAISLAINRQAITEQVLQGAAVPAAQMLPPGHAGVSESLQPDGFNPAMSRRLLAEAGLATGFAVAMQVTTDRDAADQRVAETIAQFLARIGIAVSLESLPDSVTRTRLAKGDFALVLRSWGTETGEMSMALLSVLATRDAAPGWGNANRGAYSNPALDDSLRQALASFDPQRRDVLLRHVSEVAMADLPIIPLYFQNATWALRAKLDYRARSDGYTFAWDIRPRVQR
jgi:peptide/nickel transport system substrate-binding protein